LATHRSGEPVERLEPALSSAQVLELQKRVREVPVDDTIAEYMLDIVESTRHSDELYVGVSTRGALSLYRAAQSLALVEGRPFVVPDDVKKLAVPVLVHRVIPKGFVEASRRKEMEALIRRLVDQVPVPR
jgi:MoxR-like ATPase